MKSPLNAGRAALLSVVLLVLLAGPASASTPVVLAAKPWHYWISFVLAVSFLGLLLMMAVGYVVRVLSLKYGFRIGRKAT
ncbi:MAG TPA: hypothetical protein VGP90_12975 [Acidimicrobiia bacterium]|jgi:uncharacterized integral membrane protein|nr:hypothetical protein [Acidimicrobiia bacterium]